MNWKRIVRSAITIFLLGFVMNGCAPTSVPTSVGPEPTRIEGQATEAVTEPASPAPYTAPAVYFFTWAEDDFDQATIQKMTDLYQQQTGNRVDVEFVR